SSGRSPIATAIHTPWLSSARASDTSGLQRSNPQTHARRNRGRFDASIESIAELIAIDRDRDALDGIAGEHAVQELFAHRRQDRVGQYRVDHAAAALDLGAALAHECHD